MNRKEKAAETEAALKDAAKRLFAERGYLNTKITDITAAAGRAAGSFYNHFASKEELLESLMADLSEQSDETAALPEHKSDFNDPDAIRFHVRAYLGFQRANAATLQALRQAALVRPDIAAKFARFGADETADILDHLDGIDLPTEPRVALTMMFAMVDQFIEMWPAVHPELSEEDVLEALTRFVYRGLTGKDY
ncbi:TetR/AcrR family transcriptional regulator [Amycolatopsis acidiphila]|uniref:TetR/AcrR family transcriptional regulator n=1 Tax=Amycolatopsis acidiphila TaxID=715473 RepID=A0A558A0G0_9PSEU|nr:TetR/AcrR family transcriptional regulator [Amycolatopsis acidiphila]TVT17736.1 TetR/AcrR family transcriptional regulator [Amycolatopsis acidiphila]UIJ60935.1 TetR/AcrR family transcriptional regulator [Amycolatopsis acidiphila]GHG88337.1 TetR family transcriptional regulator [Amycolatopsis acidiphila]